MDETPVAGPTRVVQVAADAAFYTTFEWMWSKSGLGLRNCTPELTVYAYVYGACNHGSGIFTMSTATLASILGISDKTIRDALVKLEGRGLVHTLSAAEYAAKVPGIHGRGRRPKAYVVDQVKINEAVSHTLSIAERQSVPTSLVVFDNPQVDEFRRELPEIPISAGATGNSVFRRELPEIEKTHATSENEQDTEQLYEDLTSTNKVIPSLPSNNPRPREEDEEGLELPELTPEAEGWFERAWETRLREPKPFFFDRDRKEARRAFQRRVAQGYEPEDLANAWLLNVDWANAEDVSGRGKWTLALFLGSKGSAESTMKRFLEQAETEREAREEAERERRRRTDPDITVRPLSVRDKGMSGWMLTVVSGGYGLDPQLKKRLSEMIFFEPDVESAVAKAEGFVGRQIKIA